MKKSFSLTALMTLSLLGPFGCGHVMNPLTPTTTAITTTAKIPSPIYKAAWNKAGTISFSNPQCIAVDANGNFYVTDMSSNEVFKLDSNGNLLTQWGNTGTDTLDQPSGIAIHNNNVFVADSSNARVVEYDLSGNIVNELMPPGPDGYSLFVYPTGISFDNAGNMYVADNSDEVYEFNSTVQLIGQWGVSGATNGIFDYPIAATEDGSGNVYVANYNPDNIVKLNAATGTVSVWGKSGSQSGQFYGPTDVKLDANGNVYVVDSGNNRIQVFNANGSYLTQWGNTPNTTQGLNGPNSMAIDSNGNIYVVDNGNSRIVKY